MQERHSDGQRYFKELAYTAKKYLLPFIESERQIEAGMRVLEIGCGMGGNLQPFVERGCQVTGVDLGADRIANASFMLQADGNPNIELIASDIFAVTNLHACFDLIVVHDVIEHIPDKDRFFMSVRKFLKPGGLLFMAFPAWQMPFGGHQQICRSRILSHLPFFHLLPRSIYRNILSLFKEPDSTIDELLSIKECGISIGQFQRYLIDYNYDIVKKRYYFINPHYEIKFHLKPRRLFSWIAAVPYMRNFFCTSAFYLIKDHCGCKE